MEYVAEATINGRQCCDIRLYIARHRIDVSVSAPLVSLGRRGRVGCVESMNHSRFPPIIIFELEDMKRLIARQNGLENLDQNLRRQLSQTALPTHW